MLVAYWTHTCRFELRDWLFKCCLSGRGVWGHFCGLYSSSYMATWCHVICRVIGGRSIDLKGLCFYGLTFLYAVGVYSLPIDPPCIGLYAQPVLWILISDSWSHPGALVYVDNTNRSEHRCESEVAKHSQSCWKMSRSSLGSSNDIYSIFNRNRWGLLISNYRPYIDIRFSVRSIRPLRIEV